MNPEPGTARVLVVDDDNDHLEIVRRQLASEDLAIQVASLGEEALAKVKEQSPDVILLDVSMPGLSGLEVCHRIKRDPATRNIQVILLSARTGLADAPEGGPEGADDYLSKPFRPEDLRARVRAGVRIKHLLDELRLSEERLSQSEKLSTLGLLVAGVCHELNNPLAVIMGYSQLMGRWCSWNERTKRATATVHDAAKRCKAIIDNLSRFARRQKLEMGLVNLNDVASTVIGQLADELKRVGIQYELQLEKRLPRIVGDSVQLQQVLLNLLKNAKQAISQGGEQGSIKIRTQALDQAVSLVIIDDGCGMDDTLRQRIFDPFFTTKPMKEGMGLGLSIVNDIVRGHGGTIEVSSTAGEGSVFRLELPVSCDKRSTSHAFRKHLISVPQLNGRRALVIDDEPFIADMVAEMLESTGLAVEGVASAEEALVRIAVNAYDLLITDIVMPGIGGPGFFQAVRSIDPELARRILFITGDITSPRTAAFLDSSHTPWVSKPFDIEELYAAIDTITEGLEATA